MEFVDNTINFMPPVVSRQRRGLFSHLSRASSHEPISSRDVDQNYFSLIYKTSYNHSLITEEYFSPKSFRHFESTFYFIYHPGMCFIIYFKWHWHYLYSQLSFFTKNFQNKFLMRNSYLLFQNTGHWFRHGLFVAQKSNGRIPIYWIKVKKQIFWIPYLTRYGYLWRSANESAG